MTEDVKDQQSNDELELASLKARATQMGLKYHHKAGLNKLRELVNGALKPETLKPISEVEASTPQVIPKKGVAGIINKGGVITTPVNQKLELSNRQKAGKLVRVRLSCMNPNKSEYEGEIFTVGNREFGFKKYVPFNNEEGWHVPQMMLDHLKSRECQIFVNSKDSKGNKVRVGKMIREFAIEELPALTPQEIEDLAQRQAMAAGGS